MNKISLKQKIEIQKKLDFKKGESIIRLVVEFLYNIKGATWTRQL
jgi:hypothetical protein